MASHIGRRKFLATLGGAAVTWPIAARAQQPAMPVVGWLGARSASESTSVIAAFRRGLQDVGYIQGKNVAIDCATPPSLFGTNLIYPQVVRPCRGHTKDEEPCADLQLFELPCNRLGGLSLPIRVQGVIKVGSQPFPRCRPPQGRQTATEHQRGFGAYGCSQRIDRWSCVYRTNEPSGFRGTS
jgi:hypothetical protein